jgi:hypothetical protein
MSAGSRYGDETRVWVGCDPDDRDKIKSTPVPGEIVERLLASGAMTP